mgnify:CR=1 FL=1
MPSTKLLALLAAALARTPNQKNQVRAHAINLLGLDDASFYCVRALQILNPPDLINDVPLLAVHQHWAARSLAAITWAQNTPIDPAVGMFLATDADPRVRRALADTAREGVAA